MKRQLHKRTAQEKEKILIDVQSLGVVVGCRKHNIPKTLYYYWLDLYNARGIEGLENQSGKNQQGHIKRLEKENRMLKEMLAEKDLEIKLKDELLKKKFGQWEKKEK